MLQELGKARALLVLEVIQRSSAVAAQDAAREDCQQSEVATGKASLPGNNLAARAAGSRDPGCKAAAEAIGDLPRHCGP
jgi:hypothetical protein